MAMLNNQRVYITIPIVNLPSPQIFLKILSWWRFARDSQLGHLPESDLSAWRPRPGRSSAPGVFSVDVHESINGIYGGFHKYHQISLEYGICMIFDTWWNIGIYIYVVVSIVMGVPQKRWMVYFRNNTVEYHGVWNGIPLPIFMEYMYR